ncbi:uncharacterized protein LOC115633127 isoform X2 [Scaptodrosophila lebanonensis]|uniref:Uncharacterized protein LOC115633127 isoform X2 n=1 Tax=Drosophila lebanonensis TaxID=7225 RepID=A0A6J2UDF4_DROLE|nr:uncharacterized protein LOC115633127 isoform X2 [Scaptodrosophila lebanonensis]
MSTTTISVPQTTAAATITATMLPSAAESEIALQEEQQQQPEQSEELLVVCIVGVQDNANVGVGLGSSGNGGTDSGRDSANEFDSANEDAAIGATEQLRVLQVEEDVSEEFYASSGSQTKWYLKPAEEVSENVTTTTLCVENNVTVVTTTTTSTAATTTTVMVGGEDEGTTERASPTTELSKSAILPRSSNDGVNIIGIRSGLSLGLSQQMRAVSSPTLTDSNTQHLAAQPKQQDEPTAGAAAAATTTFSFDAAATNGSSGGGSCGGGGGGGGSGGLGVLQKFKRTLTNFNNKNQLQITQLPPTATSAGDVATAAATTKPKSSPNNTPTVCITAANPTTAASAAAAASEADIGDANSGKYRFGPLIWRSSKERRKTKFNRRDKCNSGDSGIQIELEQDEQYARVLSASGQQSVQNETPPHASSTPNTAEAKARVIRRTNSAKAGSILDQSADLGGSSAKSKIYKQLQLGSGNNIEREAPESLPTRSLSQPNGLETYGMGRTELDDSDSDSVASHEEGSSYYPIYAEVLYKFTAAGPQELGLERGALIEILRKEVGPWWFGRIKKEDASIVEEILDPELGWFPKEFVRIIPCPDQDAFYSAHKATQGQPVPSQDVPVPVAELNNSLEDADATMTVDQSNITTIVIESPPSLSPPAMPLLPLTRLNAQLDSADVLRRSAVRELLETEVNYVKLLAAICDGYLPAMSKRIDIFSPNSIRLIFSNIAAIYKFQRKFLEALRKGIEQNQVAKVFLKMHKGFLCYSTYCNSYPRALIELESYDRVKDARTILENCRESENLAELPLSAHLLAPVQRICRYPLHLNEIIKTAMGNVPNGTDEADGSEVNKPDPAHYEQLDVSQLDIPDTHNTVNLALEAMRGITEAVNEGKRHSETIARHQASFQNFKGPPLHLHSTRFFLQIDATRQKQNLWNSSYTLFLFDNQLVYCKRDIIKRSHFIYKGRIFLDRCRVVNVRDGKMFGHTIKNSLRIYCESRDKWYDFSFRSANRKHRFLNTLALERQFGGKALYVSEMTGFEYNYEERAGDYSDQSDYELPDCEHALGGGTSASGDSSVPESPAKSSYRYSETLPKKSQSRDGIASADNSQSQPLSTTSTGSLGRRRLGNWFRKPKSTNCTPSQSPTHKPGFDADVTLTAARVATLELAEAAAAQQQTETNSA